MVGNTQKACLSSCRLLPFAKPILGLFSLAHAPYLDTYRALNLDLDLYSHPESSTFPGGAYSYLYLLFSVDVVNWVEETWVGLSSPIAETINTGHCVA